MLNMPTLVLNKTWTPINVTSVRRALSLSFLNLARIVDVDSFELYSFKRWIDRGLTNGKAIHGVDLVFDAPEIVVLQHYNKVPQGGVVFSRRNLFRRDRFRCQYCHEKPGTETLTIDHLVPRSRGGRTTWENCVLACMECNLRKGNRTPQEAGMMLRTVPKKPIWTPFYAFARQSKQPASWETFLNEAYWNTELEA